MLRVAVASGKGGTGKTTVAAGLTMILSGSHSVHYVDCDVEAPNGHFFLQPVIQKTEPVTRLVPQVDLSNCDGCGKCSEVCRFHAIATAGPRVLVFPALCHGCGGCALVCPRKAITEREHRVGEVAMGRAGAVAFTSGTLLTGETATVSVIRQVRRQDSAAEITILDCPPGTSCPVVASIEGADFVVLVTEPTAFGLNDLRLAVHMVRALKLRAGVVINRDGIGDDRVDDFCRLSGVPVIGRIPDDRAVAEAYSRGEIPLNSVTRFREALEQLAHRLTGEAGA